MPSTDRPRVLIRGSGALACLFATRLACHASVVLLTHWAQQSEALRNGLVLVSASGEEERYTVEVASRPEPASVVLILVKTDAIAAACEELAGVFAEARAVVALQNGIGAQERVRESVDGARFVPGVTYLGATKISPGIVQQRAAGITVIADEESNRVAAALVASLFQRAGFSVERSANWQAQRWRKLVLTSAVNALCAVLDVPPGELLRAESAFRLAVSLGRETLAVAHSLGIDPSISDVETYLREHVAAVHRNLPSMLQDVRAGRRTEVRHVNGAIAALARRSGMPTPLNTCLTDMVEARSMLRT